MSDRITLEKSAEQWNELKPKLVNMIYEIDAYQKIGSISECAAAVSYQNPATMIFPKGDYAICPICDHGVRIMDKYCSNCGQKLTREGWREQGDGVCESRKEKHDICSRF